MMKKVILFILGYLLIGIVSIKLMVLHPESWLHNEKSESELGAAVLVFPIVLLFDGLFNIGTYELGLLVKNDNP